jgi:transcriptional regulator with XRE-family HTH domain
MIKKNLKFKKTLTELDIKQRELSRRTGIPESYISHYANGRMQLSQTERGKIADALGVDAAEIF